MRQLSAIFLILVTVCMSHAEIVSPEIEFRVVPQSFDQEGILSLAVSFHSTSEITVYSFRGGIHPLLGYGLSVSASDEEGNTLVVESVKKMVPKLPHPTDVAVALAYEYPEPLLFRVLDADANPFRGCTVLELVYDLTSDPEGRFAASGLDLIVVRSDKIRACNEVSTDGDR